MALSRPVVLALAALVVGASSGIIASSSEAAATLIRWIEPAGLIWVAAIRMTVIPLVVASLIVAVADTDPRSMGRLGARSLGVFLLLLSIVAAFTALAAPAVFDLLNIDATAAASLRAEVGTGVAVPTLPSFADWLVSLVPVNPIAAAASGAMSPPLC